MPREYGLTEFIEGHTVTLHRVDCGSYRGTGDNNKRGPYRDIEDARNAGRNHADKPCILICRRCRSSLPHPYRDWRCLCWPGA